MKNKELSPMRVAIISPGSRGDVQPYIALGKGLTHAGNEVRLVTNQNFEILVNSHGLDFWPVEVNTQDIIQNEKMREVLEKGGLLASMSEMGKELKRAALRLAQRSLAACEGMDVVIAGFGGLFVGLSLAEKLGIPFIQAYNVPFTPTRAFSGAFFPKLPSWLGSSFNRLSHHLTRQIVWQAYRPADKLARQKVLNLPNPPFWGPFSSDCLQDSPILYGFSPSIIPPPSDWAKNIHVTGYWFLDESNWNPPSALTEFLQAGSSPLYIGFGSMSNRNPEETANLVLQALKLTKQRAIIQSGWGGLLKTDFPDSVFLVDSVSHSWLFPRVQAVVHHGGAGTTAAGLWAGVPSIIIPFHGDQPFWGQRIAELEVGPVPIPRKKLSVERLAQAINEVVTDREMRQRAANLGSKIQAEDGIARAVTVVQQIEEHGSVLDAH